MTRSNLLSKFNEGIQQSHCKSYRVFQYFTLYDSAKSNVIQNTLLQLFFVFLLLKDVSQKDDLMALFRVWDNFWQLKAL